MLGVDYLQHVMSGREHIDDNVDYIDDDVADVNTSTSNELLSYFRS